VPNKPPFRFICCIPSTTPASKRSDLKMILSAWRQAPELERLALGALIARGPARLERGFETRRRKVGLVSRCEDELAGGGVHINEHLVAKQDRRLLEDAQRKMQE